MALGYNVECSSKVKNIAPEHTSLGRHLKNFYGPQTIDMCGNGFQHSHSLPFPSIQFPFPPPPIPKFLTYSHSSWYTPHSKLTALYACDVPEAYWNATLEEKCTGMALSFPIPFHSRKFQSHSSSHASYTFVSKCATASIWLWSEVPLSCSIQYTLTYLLAVIGILKPTSGHGNGLRL